ncbi:MAG: mannose-6-phosphate isomerase [Clostridia bacterium]|nr:mannose-6-phosphate isomerase [Clostridia bacterium]
MGKYILKLLPYISETIWGGRKLIDEFNIATEKANAAEGWMLSCIEDGPCTVKNGIYMGKKLSEVLAENPDWCGADYKKYNDFPVLIKFIDAMNDLSVQVHPTKEYCLKTGRGRSKTECWYIIDCDKDAGIILGFKEKISRDEFIKAIKDNTLTEYTDFVKVKPGDFFFIDSGTLHAICKGVLLAEVQESSNTTYRIYDYNRLDKYGNPRELHISDAVEVTKLERYTQKSVAPELPNGKSLLTDNDLFKVNIINVQDEFQDNCNEESFVSLLIIDGKGFIECLDENVEIEKGDSLFIPAGSGDYTISGNFKILETRI